MLATHTRMETTADLLREAMARHGLDQKGLAESLGADASAVTRWLRGGRPRPEAAEKLAMRVSLAACDSRPDYYGWHDAAMPRHYTAQVRASLANKAHERASPLARLATNERTKR